MTDLLLSHVFNFALWNPYVGSGALLLSLILLVLGAIAIMLGTKLKKDIPLPKPSIVIGIIIAIVWILTILFLLHFIRQPSNASILAGSNAIFPITLASAFLSFLFIAYISRREGIYAAIRNAIIGAAAGPFVFEIPFVLITLPVISSPVPIHAGILFLVLLGIVEITTFALLFFCSRVAITKYSLYLLGAMLLVFAIWAFFGFSQPTNTVAFILNAVSKILSFATIDALFVAQKRKP